MEWNIDQTILCSRCNRRPASLKKLVLCETCYGYKRRHKEILIKRQISHPNHRKNPFQAEIEFALKHPNFIYQPATFRFGVYKYSPDFYDKVRNIFYEVIGTRQAFHQSKNKIKLFHEFFPYIQLRIVDQNDQPYHSRSSRRAIDKVLQYS
jgi:hypothetical protein